jgi:hypothetical protein
MHRPPPTSAAILAAWLLIEPLSSTTIAGDPPAIGEARSLLEKGQARSAVIVLEDALAAAARGQHAALVDLLRRAYAAAATDAEARGLTRDAEAYRDNLQILERTRPPTLSPWERVPKTLTCPSDIRSQGERLRVRASAPPIAMASVIGHVRASAPPSAPASDLAAADAAFRSGRYDEAGKLYAVLDRAGRLPAARRDHWAYCRWTEIVRRINARPATRQEWAEIDAEIERIRALSPNNWYGEYLRNRAAERSATRRASNPGRVVVRGSAPEEPPPRVAPSAGATAPASSPRPNGTAASGGTADGARETRKATPVVPRWQVRETPSFRILHHDSELAEKAAAVAEAARDAQIRRWVGAPPKSPWTPKCELYLYPTARIFSQMTGQPEESPGFSTMGMNSGRIIARRVSLRADHPNLLRAILPHEITHVVLADLFPHQQIPRWADEGIAVLSEPPGEQQLRAADLNDPLATGQLFPLRQLMAMDYPEGRWWGLYYAQSVSLTRFLVEQGSAGQFVEFVQRSQQNGTEAELRRIYHIDGFADLQNRWVTYAKSKTAESTATATRSEPGSESTSR